jgi:uncharacterized protein
VKRVGRTLWRSTCASALDVAPDWLVGPACGFGGLCGGYLGARLQSRLPERALRLLLGNLAIGIGALYIAQASF